MVKKRIGAEPLGSRWVRDDRQGASDAYVRDQADDDARKEGAADLAEADMVRERRENASRAAMLKFAQLKIRILNLPDTPEEYLAKCEANAAKR